jgi:hypothetical protein
VAGTTLRLQLQPATSSASEKATLLLAPWSAQMPNKLQQLHDAGISIWLDFIERTMLHNGDLERRIREEFLTGMT